MFLGTKASNRLLICSLNRLLKKTAECFEGLTMNRKSSMK